MFNVFFKNSLGQKRSIGIVKTHDEAFKLIDDFLVNHNFKSYYKNCHHPDEKTTIVDVGSWWENFTIKEMS